MGMTPVSRCQIKRDAIWQRIEGTSSSTDQNLQQTNQEPGFGQMVGKETTLHRGMGKETKSPMLCIHKACLVAAPLFTCLNELDKSKEIIELGVPARQDLSITTVLAVINCSSIRRPCLKLCCFLAMQGQT